MGIPSVGNIRPVPTHLLHRSRREAIQASFSWKAILEIPHHVVIAPECLARTMTGPCRGTTVNTAQFEVRAPLRSVAARERRPRQDVLPVLSLRNQVSQLTCAAACHSGNRVRRQALPHLVPRTQAFSAEWPTAFRLNGRTCRQGIHLLALQEGASLPILTRPGVQVHARHSHHPIPLDILHSHEQDTHRPAKAKTRDRVAEVKELEARAGVANAEDNGSGDSTGYSKGHGKRSSKDGRGGRGKSH